MSPYLTRLSDVQLSFGSGSSINADDIPESITRQWLTTNSQDIDGLKILQLILFLVAI